MDRDRLVERVRAQLEWDGWPRLMVFLIVAGAGMAGFLVSFALLSAGYDSMPLRYGLAGISGYLAFLLLLGTYVAYRRSSFDAPDLLDVVNPLDVGGSGGRALVEGTDAIGRFAGGRSGGGGAAGSWEASSSSPAAEGGSWFDGDGDGVWLLVAAAVGLAGLFAVGYVIWAAPLLIAEVLVDAAIVGAVSRKLTPLESRDWTATAIRRTWFPAAILIAALVAGGWALQKAAPDAKSIGAAVRAILEG